MAKSLELQVQELYVGYLGRAAEQEGQQFWVNGINAGTYTLADVANAFTGTEEYAAKYEGLTTVQFVAQVYQNVLGRAAEGEGLQFWVDQVDSGAVTQGALVATMLANLGAVDQLNFDNRTTAAQQYTESAGENYDLEDAIEVVGGGSTAPGSTFTLTTGADFADVAGAVRNGGVGNAPIESDFRFTNGKEVIAATGATLGGTDTLIDSSTTDADVLNLSLSGATAPGAATIQNIETINVNASAYSAGTLALTGVRGAQTLDLNGSLTAALNVTGLATSGITTVDGSGLTSITAANGITASFDTALGTIARTITGSGANDALTGSAGADVINGGAGVDQIRGGAGADTLNGDAGVDSIWGGSGNDVINGGDGNDAVLNGEEGNDTIDGGAGDDQIDGGAGNDVLLGGAGADTIVTGTGNNTVTGGAGADNITLGGGLDTVIFEATGTGSAGNGVDVIKGFETGIATVANGGDKLDFSAFLGAAAKFGFVPTDSVGTVADAGFTATDYNVVALAADADVATAAQLQAAIGNDASDLHLAISSKTVVLLEVADWDTVTPLAQPGVQAYYVTTNELGEASEVSLVGNIDAATAAGFVDFNFV